MTLCSKLFSFLNLYATETYVASLFNIKKNIIRIEDEKVPLFTASSYVNG